MEILKDYILVAWNYFTAIRLMDVIDILIVAALIFYLLGIIRRTNTMKVANGIFMLLAALFVSGLVGLNMVNFLLRKAFELGLLALVVLFQPELRRLLEKMGSGRWGAFLRSGGPRATDAAIDQVVLACTDMARTRTGALIIFERDNPLTDQMNTGTQVDAEITAELLKNIFYPKAPLHDGAVIIRNGRLNAAGCMLPLSHNNNLSRDLGMRHRAGIGMSEQADAVVVIVSEETGSISVAVDGMLKRHLTTETFQKVLQNELAAQPEENGRFTLAGLFRREKGEGDQ